MKEKSSKLINVNFRKCSLGAMIFADKRCRTASWPHHANLARHRRLMRQKSVA